MPSKKKATARPSLRKQVEQLTARVAALEEITRPPVIHSIPTPPSVPLCSVTWATQNAPALPTVKGV